MLLHRDAFNEEFVSVRTGFDVSEIGAQRRANSGGTDRLDHFRGGFALQDGSGPAYNEEAFHYFLEIERRRSEISNRPFLLMLIEFKGDPGSNPRIDDVTAGKLFSVLSLCLRETDFIGWYREERVAGAVLTQHRETEGDDLSDVVCQRIGGALRQRLPFDLALGLQVRVYQLSPSTMSRNG
jgi:hypothetical protein